MSDADAEGTCGDPSCGDSLTLYIKVKNNIIEAAKSHDSTVPSRLNIN